MTSWSELQEGQTGNVGKVDTWNVTEGLDEGGLVGIDNERTTSLNVTTVSHLTLTGADVARSNDTLDIGIGVDLLQELNGSLGSGDSGEVVRTDNERDLSNVVDLVSTGHDQSWDGRSGQS
jgi:hypothetical protein